MFILRKTCTCSFIVFISFIHISSLVDGRMYLIQLYKTNVAIWCNKTCGQKRLMPNYISIKVNGNNHQSLCKRLKQSIRHILLSTRLLVWMREKNTIQLHVQAFLRMNTWMFETYLRHYNSIKTLM